MKVRILFFALLFSVCSWGQTTLATFNFESSNLTASSGAIGSPVLTGSTAVTYFGGSTVSPTASACFASANTRYFELTIATTGYSSITVDWNGRISSLSGSWVVTANSGSGYGATLSTQTLSTTFAAAPQLGLAAAFDNNPTIKIRWTASVSATQTIRIDDIVIKGTATTPCTTPTTQASAITSSNVTTTGADLSWTDGASTSGSLVALKLQASAIAAPTSGTDYTPTLNFSTAVGANLINAANVVVAKNGAETVAGITGLSPGTQYTATPYAYNGSGTNVCFNTTNPESLDFYTLALEPTASPASLTCGVSTPISIGLTYPAASGIPNANGYVIIYREGAAPTGMPVDGTLYGTGDIIGDATFYSYVSSASVGTTVNGLNSGATYYFALIPYGSYLSVVQTLNYKITSPRITNCTTAAGPEIDMRGVIGANPSILDGDITPSLSDNTLYGTVVVASSQAKNFRIANTGNLPLSVTGITKVGGNTGDFVATTLALGVIPFPLSIAAGTFYDFTVTFTPSAAGTRNTTLTIANNDNTVSEQSYQFLLEGTGTLTPIVEINVKGNGQSIPDNSIYPQGTNWTYFPVTLQGFTSTRTFTIENLGTTVLSLTGASPYVQITGAHASLFTVTSIPSNSIAGGATTTFVITFSPLSGGAKNATVTILNNDTDEAVYNFNIAGTCQGSNNIYVSGNGNDVPKGAVTTNTTNLTDFGLVAVTTGVKQNTFVITNLSGASRYLSNASISGADAAMFTIISQPNNGTFSNGNTTSFTINFTPTSAGVKNATVTFNTYTDAARTTLDPLDPVFTFAISGEGIVYTSCTNNAVQTIVIQDFDGATPTWNYNTTPLVTDGTVTIAGGTYNNGSGAVNAFLGTNSFQFKGIGTSTTRSAVLTMNSVNVSQYNNINFSMRVGAFRTTGSTQGLDVNDLIQVETSIDGGVNWSVESVLRGYTNSRWNFATTGAFNAYYTGNNSGITMDTRLGNAELTGAAGISTYYVKNLPQATNLLIRISLFVDRDDELWAIDNIKIEGQTPQATIWNGAAWSAGFPTPSTKAIIDTGATYTTVTDIAHGIGSVEACELEIRSSAIVTVAPNYYFEIQSDIKNSGSLTIANNASLVQVNDTAINTGDINYLRDVASLRGFDYIYWSSPVVNQALGSLYSTPTPGYRYEWNPVASNPSGSYGFWVAPVSATMEAAKGYILRASNSYGWTGSLTSTFIGKPNNGVISPTLSRIANSAIVNDRWNLIGNPYPSSLDAKAFLAQNAVTNPTIDGYIGLWQHLNAPVSATSPYYSTYQYNYTNDYLIYNRTGPQTQGGFNGYVASGQAFFVNLLQDPAPTSTVTFKNAFRNKTYDNSQFLRTSQNEEGRIWIDLVNSANVPVRSLIGYVDGATQERDILYDAITTIGINNSIHSVIGTDIFAIQGRAIPFDSEDRVPLGYNATTAGNYKIAIAGVDGLFTQDQPVFLEDKLLGVIFDLRQNPYSFDSAAGTCNDRFVLRYNNTALGNPDFGSADNTVIVSNHHGQMTINSLVESIQAVTVYDILGRQLFEAKSIRNKDFTASNISISQQALIVKIKLENGTIITKKVVL